MIIYTVKLVEKIEIAHSNYRMYLMSRSSRTRYVHLGFFSVCQTYCLLREFLFERQWRPCLLRHWTSEKESNECLRKYNNGSRKRTANCKDMKSKKKKKQSMSLHVTIDLSNFRFLTEAYTPDYRIPT